MGAADKLDDVLARLDADLDASLARLFDLLRIPSVSTEAAHRADCAKAADWLKAELEDLGMSAEVISVPEVPDGHPLVFGEGLGAATDGAPTVLFYGHYDVQPVDPVELWTTPPFEPTILEKDGRKIIQCRGAADDKGQVMTFLTACRAWRDAAGAPPVAVKVLLEGEEEAGGESMAPFLKAHQNRLAAAVALVCDTGMWAPGRPAVTMSLRGMAGGAVTIKAANRDLHSGHYGSAARNPLALMARILSDLRDDEGRVTLKGFYDGVPETSAEMKASWDRLGFEPQAFLGEIGLSVPAGEADRSVLEQTWARPTAEINGMWGGYTGDGFKTVIPAEAHAKVSFRLVGRQDPDAVWDSFESHVRHHLPHDCTAEFTRGHGAPAISMSPDTPAIRQAAKALEAEWGAPTALIGAGGSIPVVEEFKRLLGMDALLVGFGLDDDAIHSPNEKYDLQSFHKGARSWARILAELADGDA